ncbi:MAG: type II toxin-antitoxin system RelE/ParE family toxin [Oscillatoriales cyanobacterium RU_3_3]|nr:type II toxin-antitoxin system RelE/ParE family toxin [Microcoleus sp. SU_5_6]NJM60116.1 type II toxin-antitoxin system RelE/ParE family toxin [Oscillatoriales cyanobacterium RU_3_3]NJR26519.1 type II toxin-antitoxin system RelE/ParE family toxin [Richelia sp. CSU_2_1]
MEPKPQQIKSYSQPDGTVPVDEWLDSLRDFKGKAKIVKRLERFRGGNLGDYRSVGEGVSELRIDFGPGYRVYFGQVGETIMLLLCGGDKSTQEQDIRTAKKYWEEYRSRENA